VAYKDRRVLAVYARNEGGPWQPLRTLPILAASGGPGPKLRDGDRQVPEGIYAIESANPNSLYHLALRIGYPNADDRARAREEQRTELGGDIMIHGSTGSIGCLAMGDEGIEDLFVLAVQTGLPRVRVLLVPTDLRMHPNWQCPTAVPPWMPARYARLREALAELP
jgi:murein L,D-transpeptidase YafK